MNSWSWKGPHLRPWNVHEIFRPNISKKSDIWTFLPAICTSHTHAVELFGSNPTSTFAMESPPWNSGQNGLTQFSASQLQDRTRAGSKRSGFFKSKPTWTTCPRCWTHLANPDSGTTKRPLAFPAKQRIETVYSLDVLALFPRTLLVQAGGCRQHLYGQQTEATWPNPVSWRIEDCRIWVQNCTPSPALLPSGPPRYGWV